MLSIFEIDDSEKEFKRGDVGAGYGKMVGSALGVPGIVAGHYIGKGMIDNPDAPADLTKKSHRVGLIADRKLDKSTAAAAGIGAGTGAALGSWMGEDPAQGALIGAIVGGIMKSLHGGYQAAKKMGYASVGKTAAAVTPFAGLTTPKRIKEKQRELYKKQEQE